MQRLRSGLIAPALLALALGACNRLDAATPAAPSATGLGTPTAGARSVDTAALSAPASPATSPSPITVHGTAYALLADNRLLAVRAQDGRVLAEHRLAPAPSTQRSAGHRLALSADGSRLFALATGDPGGADVAAVIDGATSAVLATYPLDDSGNVFRGLAVGPRTGRLYLFGVGGRDLFGVGPRGVISAWPSWTPQPARRWPPRSAGWATTNCSRGPSRPTNGGSSWPTISRASASMS